MRTVQEKAVESSVIQDLITQCNKGQEAAFKQLYDRYAKAMYNTCYRIVNDHALAKDAMQEGFIKAFAQINRFEGKSTFGYWLKRIMINESISEIRKKKPHLDIENLETVADVQEEQSEYRRSFNLDQIHRCIQSLAPGYRTILSLYLLEGYDHQEIAKILNVAESTTRTQYIRAKKKLRQNLETI